MILKVALLAVLVSGLGVVLLVMNLQNSQPAPALPRHKRTAQEQAMLNSLTSVAPHPVQKMH